MNWDDDYQDEPRILGTGVYTNMPSAGKSKMAQIGFIRNGTKRTKNVPRKSRVPVKGRSKTSPARSKKNER